MSNYCNKEMNSNLKLKYKDGLACLHISCFLYGKRSLVWFRIDKNIII